MPTILCAMPADTYARMMTPALEDRLRSLGEVVACPDARALPDADYGRLWERADAALTGWGVRPPTDAILDQARRLRVIAHTAGSVRMFPRHALEKGVVITSARAAIARTVAEFCVLNALTLLRRYLYYTDTAPARRAFYARGGQAPASETLFGKTVGLVGFGEVGRIHRRLLAPFGCRVLVHDPFVSDSDVLEAGADPVGLHELLRHSKVVSLHVPDILETRGMIGARELAMLQDGAVFLNSARGRAVDTVALTEALGSGRLLAAIDVTDPEPLPEDHPLRAMPNVLLTPHIAGPTTDDLPHLTATALDDLEAVLRGREPRYPISLEAYDLMSF